jgi:hypothetical protein
MAFGLKARRQGRRRCAGIAVLRSSSDDERIASSVMDPQFKELANEISGAVEKRLQIHFENVEGLIRLTAEGYGASLDRIERDLKELNSKFDTTFGDHDLVLSDHNTRITKLEKHR